MTDLRGGAGAPEGARTGRKAAGSAGSEQGRAVPGPVLELQGVSFGYDGRPVLEEIDLTLRRGDYLGIIGPNGGGKTTLLRLVLGLLAPDRGRIRVLGGPPRETRGEVGYVPQYARFDIDFPIRVRDTVRMGRLGRRGAKRGWGPEDRRAVGEALERLALTDLADVQIGRLSGGQVQRVLLARALALEPKLLLLDEPTASVDTRVGRSIYELLEELSREVTVVLVSHDIGVISRHVKTVACLNRRLWYHGTGELTPEMVEAAYGCPVDLVAHGHPHRVLGEHGS